MEESELETGEDRNFVTALARGLEVLRCFRPNEMTLTNQDIATRTGLPKPTVTRLTYTLRKLGYLVHSERTGTYRLGAGVLSLGYGVLAGMEIGDRAAEEMRGLCDGPNPHVTAALGERHRLKVVYMAVRRSHQAVSLTMNVGARLPLFHSAIGRAILVAMPEQERAHMIYLAEQEHPEDSRKIRDSVARALDDFARYGFCTSFGDWRAEVNGIAVPVMSLNGDRIYGLNVGGPSFLVAPEQLIADYGDRLKAAAELLSRQGVQP
ncbi:IclR family transcriptional regulator [Acidimangrovimonas pyrenivorans]|uniref:IclR family transcriptional regulator n=1 Tax=Acidimangrovimonas pyrenivorans TaxID=2030798 RepID=A0ABV7AE13_9RHOB